MKLPQTIKNEKTPTVGLGFKVQNILVVNGFEIAEAFSKPGLNGKVAYSILEKNSRIQSKSYSTSDLTTSDTNINICLHSSTSVGGEKW